MIVPIKQLMLVNNLYQILKRSRSMLSEKRVKILIAINILNLLLISAANVYAIQMPQLVNPDKFKIELCANLAEFGRLKVFQLVFTSGENGFPAGLYMS